VSADGIVKGTTPLTVPIKKEVSKISKCKKEREIIMKKYFIMLVMMLTMSVYSFAEENTATKIAETEKYELKINHRKLAHILNMSSDQIEMSNDIISEFERDMVFASVMDTEESRSSIVRNAVNKNIKNMHYVLNGKQYKKYLMLLNLTLENRGFDVTKISE
jgi:hypothetical protein